GMVTYSDGQTSVNIAAGARVFLPSQTGLPDAFYQYEADLTGLRAGTPYQYKILMDGKELKADSADAKSRQFTTAGSGPVSFLVLGDSGSGSPEQLQLADKL